MLNAATGDAQDTIRLKLRQDLHLIGEAALRAVNPAEAVRRYLRREGASLCIAGEVWVDDIDCTPLLVLAIGKAAAPMAASVFDILGAGASHDLSNVTGLIVTKYHHASGYELPSEIEIIEAGHPIPDANGLRAGEAVMSRLRNLGDKERVILLLSGGGSALMPAPVAGVTLEDLQDLTEVFLGVGATIGEINAIRKHLSQLKGGQLARLAAPALLAALILSDVVGDSLDVIASGPTAPDPTTFDHALGILKRYGVLDRVPASIASYLEAGRLGEHAETPKPGDSLFTTVRNVIVGSNYIAARAAVAQAKALGYHSLLLTTFVEGEAREVARVAVALVKEIRAYGTPVPLPACLVWGGETTVTLKGNGKGGRNQELALAAAVGLEGLEGVAVMALATDGTDGPTDAAGAMVDGMSADRARQLGWDCRAALADNNAYPLLDATGDLLRTGPTGTNVNDLLVILVR